MSTRLLKAARDNDTYAKFENKVMAFVKWYQMPRHWTKKDLADFYEKSRGISWTIARIEKTEKGEKRVIWRKK